MATCEPVYAIACFRTKADGGYQACLCKTPQPSSRTSTTHLTSNLNPHTTHTGQGYAHWIINTSHCNIQGKGEHAGALGALQLVRPSVIGVVSHIARGPRSLGMRETMHSGMDLGRLDMLSYAGEATQSALPVIDRLMAIVRRGGGAISSPGTLRGNATSLESLVVNGEEQEWVRARAAEQTLCGTIWVHGGSSCG